MRSDIAAIPLAMPIFIGPATLGTLVVMSADVTGFGSRVSAACAWIAAIGGIRLTLLGAAWLEYRLGRRGLGIACALPRSFSQPSRRR